jgi:hypothetical protein
MSNEARAIPQVETVNVPLSERGLTDLAAMLVKSGRLSAASFREWAHRTQQIAGRWATETSKTSAAKGSVTTKASSTTASRSQGKAKKVSKDAEKFRVLKLLLPKCKLGNWDEVINLKPDKAIALQKELLELRGKFLAAEGGQGIREVLNEDDYKISKSVFPYLPRFRDPSSRDVLGECANSGEGGGQDKPGPNPPNPGGNGDTNANSGSGDGGDTTNSQKSKAGPGEVLLLPITRGLKPPVGPLTPEELKEFYSKYNWVLLPSPLPTDLGKFLMPASAFVGVTKKAWGQRSNLDKIKVLKAVLERTA